MTRGALGSIARFFAAENEYFSLDPTRRDIAPLLAELDPEVVVEVPASLPHGGIWKGHAGFESLFGAVATHWSEFRVVWDADGFHELGADRVMCEGRVQGIRRAVGDTVDTPIISIFTFSDAGVVRLVHFYADTGSLVLAAQDS